MYLQTIAIVSTKWCTPIQSSRTNRANKKTASLGLNVAHFETLGQNINFPRYENLSFHYPFNIGVEYSTLI